MKTLPKVCAALGFGVLVSSGCGGSDSKKKPTVEGTTIEEIAHEAADECDDDKDNDEDGFADCDDLDCRTDAKDKCRFAPELDRTVPTNLRDGGVLVLEYERQGYLGAALSKRQRASSRSACLKRSSGAARTCRSACWTHKDTSSAALGSTCSTHTTPCRA